MRLINNDFAKQIEELKCSGASAQELRELLGRGRSRKGIFEGDLVEGELEIGQVASSVHSIIPARQVIDEMIAEFNEVSRKMCEIKF